MKKRVHKILLILCMHIGLFASTNTIEIDLNVQYQEIDNFGASDCWSMQKIGSWISSQKEKVADLLFSVEEGIGLSAWRFNLGAGINHNRIHHPWRTVETFEIGQEEYDWTRQEEERWFLNAAKERGVDQFIAFVNSPPARMTRNGFTNCTDGLGSTNLKGGYETQYATYLADILKHFRDEWDIEFNQISPVNEPQWEWNGGNQEGNRASNSDIIGIVNALYTKLREYELDTEISLLESGNLNSWYNEIEYLESEYGKTYGDYLSSVINNPLIKDKICHHFVGHSYWSDRLVGQLTEHRQSLFMKMLPYFTNGWKYWMTEYCILDGPLGEGGHGRDLTINTALDVARVIHYDLTMLRASAWQWWTAVSPEDYKDGLIYTDYKDNPNSQNIIKSKTLWALGNYSRYIRPGFIRVGCAGASDKYGLMGSAYISPDSDKIVIVFVNVSNSNQFVELNLSGLNDGKFVDEFTPVVTSNKTGDDLKEYESFAANTGYEIPSRSIVTLIADISDSNHIDNQSNTPVNFKLFQNYPNPFNNGTRISYYLSETNNIQISVYSLLGECVKTIFNDKQESGEHIIDWNGTNNNNEVVGSGVYLYALNIGESRKIKKMVFIQ